MINQSDIIKFSQKGFDGLGYIRMQTEAIEDRLTLFDGKVYLEIWGKFLRDAHAARVLPGFLVDTKVRIFRDLIDHAAILFCVNADDILNNRQMTNEDVDYESYIVGMLETIHLELAQLPSVVVNKISHENSHDRIDAFIEHLEWLGYECYRRYLIAGYPHNVGSILSNQGFGWDDYIETDKNLILVTGAASNSGKMSTCLWQIYLDHLSGLDSGYAKYETFPIRNLPLYHPINLAYEAATADIGDCNCIDTFYEKAYWEQVVNYNRDVEAFPIITGLIQKIIGSDNHMQYYHSPTDMGINQAGFCITDELVVQKACLDEILRRKQWYEQMVARGEWQQSWVERCENLERKCREW